MYCIQCGSPLEEREIEGRLRQVCPRCGYVAYRQLKVGAGALVEQEGRILLVQRGPEAVFPGTWSLPAGYCEADESPQAAAAREVAEETGLQVRVGRLFDIYYFDDDPRGNGLLIVYEAEVLGGELRPDGQETTFAGFFAPDEVPGSICGAGHARLIDAWRARALDRWQPGEPPRYCPHCAHPLEERLAFQRRRLVCPACGFVHFRELKVGITVLVEREGAVLLVQRAIEPGRGQWALPSGFVEWDETPEAAAARELEEETGLRVTHLELVDVARYSDDFRGPGINLTYRAEVGVGALQAGDDAGLARFFLPAELPPANEVAFQGHRQTLARWQAAQEQRGESG